MTDTRCVRLGFLVAAAALGACGQPGARFASPAAQVARNVPEAATAAAPEAVPVPMPESGAGVGAETGPGAPDGPAPGVDTPAGASGASPLLGPDGSVVAGPAVGPDGKPLEALATPEPDPKPAGGVSAQGQAPGSRKNKISAACCGWDWGGGTGVADRLYGYFGHSYADLYYDDWGDAIVGYLDGRRVYVEDGDDYLYGSIGWATVNLRRYNGWWSDTIQGYLGSHYVKLTAGSRSLKGYEGGITFSTGTSWDGRSLTGTYSGGRVSVAHASGYISGYLGHRGVRIANGYSTYGGYLGGKTVNLYADMTGAALLRRLPLLAADDWMIVSALAEFFD